MGREAKIVFRWPVRGRTDAAVTYVLQLVSLGLGFVSQVMVARFLGVSGYGVYAYALAWPSMVSQPSLLGLDRVVIREVAIYRRKGEFGHMRGLLRRADQVALLGAGTLGAVAAAIALPISRSALRASVVIGLLTIPLIALGRVRFAALQGMKRASLGQLTQSVGRTIYFIIFLAIAVAVSSKHLRPEIAVAMQALAFAAAVASGSAAVRRTIPVEARRSRPEFEGRKWAKGLPALTLLSALTTLNSQLGLIFLGALDTPADAGIFNAALRTSALVSLGLGAIGAVVAPRISELYAIGDRDAIQRLLRKSAWAAVALAIPPGLFATLLAPSFLAVFGHGFRGGGTALVILALGQVFNAATGTVGVALIMTRYERSAMVAQAVGTGANALLCVLLIPRWHSTGAAVAASASLITINALYVTAVVRRLKIRPGI